MTQSAHPIAKQALHISRHCAEAERAIDITTIGARTGQPRRIEMWFYRVDDACYLTTQPSRRSWYANLLAHPQFNVHVKNGVHADLWATAVPVTEPADRRHVLAAVIQDLEYYLERQRHPQRLPPLTSWVERSPLIRFTVD